MNVRHLSRRLTTVVAATSTAGLLAGALAVSPVTAATSAPLEKRGNTSLAAVLAADGTSFDTTRKDFDVLEAAVLAVLDAKPDSAVGLLTQGKKRATAFLPTDGAFIRLAADLTGKQPRNEKRAFSVIAGAVDIDTIETILLYHVVPGRTLGSAKVVATDGGAVETAIGKHLRVKVRGGKVILADADYDSRNARVKQLDINKGNKQIAHGINRVLRPIDL